MKKFDTFAIMLSLLIITGCAGCGDSDDDAPQFDITITGAETQVSYEGGTITLNVTSSDVYFVESKSSFATVSKSSGSKGTSSVDVTLTKNTGKNTRDAVIVFGNSSNKKEVSITQQGDPDAAKITGPDGYELVWHDEFEDADLSSDWTYEVQSAGWVNAELQNYIKGEKDGKKTVETKDGILNINCFKASDGKIYSGRIKAKESTGWQYGYMEARIKLPKGKGTWPAFWMMPCNVDWANEGWPKCGEIDIMEEVGVDANRVSSSLHAEGHVHTNNTQITHEMYLEGAEDDFHIYAIEWSKEKIITYVDGKLQLSYKSDGTVVNYPYDKAYYIILNLAWGGLWGGYNGVDESALPVTMQVDYVRVFQKQ